MKNLVITVSPDSSIELLEEFADTIVLDKEAVPNNLPFYETIYIRSHFGQPSTLPEMFRSEIEDIVQRVIHENPDVKFIDNTDSIDKILFAEDKWLQYKTFSKFMPKTRLLNNDLDNSDFEHPIYKNRLSSHGNGVTWDIQETKIPRQDWLIQKSLNIIEELRVYVIHSNVYPIGAVRQSKTSDQNTQALDSRPLRSDEIEFASRIGKEAPSMDIIGLDIAKNSDGKFYLMEVNRSPGFGKFAVLTGVNLARFLYGEKF